MQNKVKLYRYTGKPLNTNHSKLQQADLTREMDRLESIHGKCGPANATVFQKELDKFHDTLKKKYPIAKEIDYPNEYEMKMLIKSYGSIAVCVENGKSVLYILDQ